MKGLNKNINMAKIRPFTGIRYNLNLITDISLVTSPPYDVISHHDQKMYYEKHENNIIRLILGLEYPGDNETGNKYTRAKNYFKDWQKKDILISDDTPSIYLYSQEFTLKGHKEAQILHGFICLVKLEDFSSGIICPHEQTLSAPKKDRFELMRNCEANFSQIYGLYSDKKFQIEKFLNPIFKTPPLIKTPDKDGVKNELWKVSDIDVINQITTLMKDKVIVIGDGHHRYETALNYKNERKNNNPSHTGQEPYNYVMFMLVNAEDPGLTILPTHRLLHNLSDLNMKSLMNQISEYFEITKLDYDIESEITISRKMVEIGKTKHAFCLYAGKDDYYLLVLKDEKAIERYTDKSKSDVWQKLDVAILHNFIIEQFLDIGHHHLKDGKHIVYNHNFNDCIERVNKGEFQLALFLNPTHPDEVMEISGQGELMPQKSTYFYPKLLTGLVINKL
ncbi:DUF1015 domain-containing protein [Candidatus Desantisbacteria bacterium]|nr:DUF1015 domain-containing protein [Candidatus Desantisbacteria bacterium]